MEPYRPQVDREVLALVRSQAFTPRDFVIDPEGVCKLHPELARRVTALNEGSAVGLPPLENLLIAGAQTRDLK